MHTKLGVCDFLSIFQIFRDLSDHSTLLSVTTATLWSSRNILDSHGMDVKLRLFTVMHRDTQRNVWENFEVKATWVALPRCRTSCRYANTSVIRQATASCNLGIFSPRRKAKAFWWKAKRSRTWTNTIKFFDESLPHLLFICCSFFLLLRPLVSLWTLVIVQSGLSGWL